MGLSRINKEILSLSIPSIVTNITTPLLGLVDVAIVGHMGDPIFIAAIAVGGSMFNMLYWLFAFLRMGSSGMTAQACGAGDMHTSSLILYRALVVAGAASVVMIALQSPIADGVLTFMDADNATRDLARRYFGICIYGAPAVLGTYSLSGWFLGMQNSKAPMWISIIINMSNIAISLVLVIGLGLQIEGVATGTLTAQWLGFFAGLWLCRRYRLRHPALAEVLRWSGLRRFFSVNVDIFLRTLCLVGVTLWFTRVGAIQGTVMLAVNTLLMQFFMLFSFFMDGFAFAGEALCGRFVGAGDREALRQCVVALFKWSISLATLFTLLYFAGGEWFLGLLSSDEVVTDRATEYFWWVMAVPFAGFAAFTWDAVFIGDTRTRGMLLSMILATAVYFGLYIIFFPRLGNHGLWLAFVAYLLTRGVVQSILGRRYLRRQ
ncbi:MAG: MATE family efflux transporter [Pseudoflavonifractor sp.]|nr:MATE family efflux transporter [Pseudoflavonifractor sp.]